MKNTLPDYTRKKGQPRDYSPAQEVKAKLPKLAQKQIDDFTRDINLTFTSKHTLTTAQNVSIMFFDVIGKPLSKIKGDDVKHFAMLVNNSDRSRGGRKHIFFMLRRFLDKYTGEKYLKLVKNKRETGNGSRITKASLITSEELEAILRQADSQKNKALVMLLWESGARPDEILNLRWKDVVINDDGLAEISLFSGKKKETRTIIVQDCVLHLRRWKAEYSYPNLAPNDYVFPNKARDQPLSTQYLTRLLKRLGEKANIEKPVFSYLFRHSRLTFLRQKLKTPHYTQFAGHSEKQASSYTHLDSDDLREALLSEIYVTKEITPTRKHELEERLENIEKTLKLLAQQKNQDDDIKHVLSSIN